MSRIAVAAIFEDGISAKKYIIISGAPKATANHDLQDLAEKNILVPTEGVISSGSNDCFR